jgi:hypothetical protein
VQERSREGGKSCPQREVSSVGDQPCCQEPDSGKPTEDEEKLQEAHLQAAERGLRRLDAAVGRTGPEGLARILESFKLDSMERVDNLETLKEIVLKLEEVAAEGDQKSGR